MIGIFVTISNFDISDMPTSIFQIYEPHGVRIR